MKSKSRAIATAAFLLAILTAAFFYGGGYAPAGNTSMPPAPVSLSGESKNAQPAEYAQPLPAAVSGATAEAVQPAALPSGSQPADASISGSPNTDAPADSSLQNGTAAATSPASTATAPAAPAAASNSSSNTAGSCTLSISCATIFNNLSAFDPAKVDLLPAGGLILQVDKASFTKGESVFDLLIREARQNKIHLEYEDNPVYGSAYIEGINNIYEFDCGELSGWTYKVNGAYPGCGCSLYKLKEGDIVEIVYTCDLGHDVGAVVPGGSN